MSALDAAYRVTERLWWGMTFRGIVVLVAVLTVVRIAVANYVGMLWDEPYYWLWSRHLSPGYFDHPPMVALWIRAGTMFLGDSVLGIRALFILNQLAVPALIYMTGRVLFDRRTAERAALWTAVAPLLSIAGMMATPDGPSAFFWSLTVLAFAGVVRSGNGAWWLAVGVAAGLGLISKYTNFFIGAGLLLVLIVDPQLRRWLVSPWLWLGGVLALLIFMPVVMWNAGHDWASFRFQFGRVGEATFRPVDLITLIVVQPLIFNPLAAVFLAQAIGLWTRRVQPWGREIGLLVMLAIPAVVFILFQATHGAVLQHWLAPTFPTLILAAVAAAGRLPDDRKYLRRIRADVVPFALVAAVVVWTYALTPADRFFPGKDPLDSLRGWPAFADAVEVLRKQAGAGWVATVRYEMTGELSYELRERAPVAPVTERARYDYAPLPPAALLDQPALLVTKLPPENYAGCFASLEKVGTASRYGGRDAPIEILSAYRATGAARDLWTRGCDGAKP